MRLLLLGSGAKDHAIGWWISKSNLIAELFVVPGNIGTYDFARSLRNLDINDPALVVNACRFHKINHVLIGTESPLKSGVVDALMKAGIEVFGAPLKALRLEDDKAFSRSFTEKRDIPTPKGHLFDEEEAFRAFIEENKGYQFVIKSNQMAPSRVMLNSSDQKALLEYGLKLLKDGTILVEEAIKGIPASSTIFIDHEGYLMLPLTSDYTDVSDKDSTPTGGMGSVCPIPLEGVIREKIIERIIKPTIEGLREEGMLYKGVLTLSLVVNESLNPVLVDYHVRFNDPATQAMVPIIENDIIEILMKMERNEVGTLELRTSKECTVAVILASPGYPESPEKGLPLRGINNAFLANLRMKPYVFCGAIGDRNGEMETTGGRVLTVVGHGANIEEANRQAYAFIEKHHHERLWWRSDIGGSYFERSALKVE